MNENQFKNDAKSIVDLFFNTKLFKDDVTRDDMNGTEEFIAYCMQSRFESYLKIQKLLESIEKNKIK